MAQTPPPSLTAPPPAPQTTDRATFDSRADALVAWLSTMVTQMTSALANVYANAVDAYNNAVAAAASAVSALASANASSASAALAAGSVGAVVWNPATNYAFGATAWSPTDYLTYRRLIAGVSATDPSADPVNWALVAYPAPILVDVTGTTHNAVVNTHCVLSNVAATTVTLPAAPAPSDTVWITPGNGLYTNVVARNGNNIMSLAENLTINDPHVTVGLCYINSTIGWRLV